MGLARYFYAILVLLYVPAICWFGYSENLIKFERLYFALIVVAAILLLSSRGFSLDFPLPVYIIFIFLIWTAIGSFFSIDLWLVFSRVITVLTRLLVVLLIVEFVRRYALLDCLLASFILATVLSAPIFLISPQQYSDLAGRLYGLTGNANSYGVQVTASLIASLYFFGKSRALIIKLGALSVIVLCIYLILLTGSRKAIAGIFAVFAIYIYFESKRLSKISLKKTAALVIPILILNVVSFVLLRDSPHFHRIERLLNAYLSGDAASHLESSEINRFYLYQEGWKAAMENPIFGVGLKNFGEIELGFFNQQAGTYAHSSYIELLATSGIVGFTLWYLVWLVSFFKLVKIKAENKVIANIGITMLVINLIYDVGAVSYYHKVSWTTFALIFCCLVYVRKKRIRYG